MELGGKTPVMVFYDFDLDQAVNYAAFGAFIGAGQTCVCANRHLVQETIYDAFVEKLAAKAERLRIGDPFDPATQLGPVISSKQRDRVLGYAGLVLILGIEPRNKPLEELKPDAVGLGPTPIGFAADPLSDCSRRPS